MRARIAPLFVALFALASAATASAQQPVKIAYIDSQRITAQATAATEARQSLERDMERYKGELRVLEDSLKTMISDYEQKQVMLSPDAKRTRQEAIVQKQREFQQRATQIEEQASKRQAEVIQPVLARIQGVIDEIRREEGYALILDASGGGIVSADPALDITDKVLARLQTTAQQ